MTQQALIMFSLGPVQDFIAGARSTRDLWAGSYILSHLSHRSYTASLAAGAKPVYPIIAENKKQDFTPSFPNKFILEVGFDQAEKIGEIAEAAAREGWKEIATSVKRFLHDFPDKEVWSGWDEQIDNLLEVYWVAIPSPVIVDLETLESNRNAIANLNRLLDGRKLVRNFRQHNGDEREKDTLDGLFEQMGPLNATRSKRAEFWSSLREWLVNGRTTARLAESERLSAINLTKRLAWDCFFRRQFQTSLPMPSTSAIATSAWKQKVKLVLEYPEIKEALDRYIQALQPFLQEIQEPGKYSTFDEIDGEYFFLECLELSSRSGNPTTAELASVAKPLLKAFLAELRKIEATLASPPRYYATLMLDGDNMGKILSGVEVITGKPPREPALISATLLKYTEQILNIVEDAEGYCGKVVYKGGDDALILLPIENLLACAQKLKEAFPLVETTVSMGASIAHYKQPLQATLEAARNSEKVAKNHSFGRNALVITTLKRSGEVVLAGTNWTVADEDKVWEFEVIPVLDELRNNIASGSVSARLPYRLSQETRRLFLTDNNLKPTRILQSEFLRLFKRHSENLKLADLENKLEKIAGQGDFENFFNLLLVAAFLARGGKEE